jgi:hypothetical protein
MEELTADYTRGALHPTDVKHALANAINMILQVICLFLYLLYSLSFPKCEHGLLRRDFDQQLLQ